MQDLYERKCPDCKSGMSPIEIIDNTVSALGLDMLNLPKQRALEYVLPGGKPSFLSGTVKPAGDVVALMCTECARILLYGRPRSS